MLPGETDDPVIGLAKPMSSISEKRTRGLLPKKLAAYDLQSTDLDADVPPWQCDVCHLQLSSKESLRRHVLARHIKQPVHDCHLCTSSFVLKFQLLQHVRQSHPSEPSANSHPCICGRVFTRRNSLLCHIKRVHHPVPLQRPACHLCAKTFNDKAALRTHHAQVHAPASLPCPHPGCDKLFRTPGLRNAHYRYHEGRQFCCTICDKPFSTRSYRDKHELTHSGVRQYVCGECGVACITASQLGTHVRRRHATRQPPVREGTREPSATLQPRVKKGIRKAPVRDGSKQPPGRVVTIPGGEGRKADQDLDDPEPVDVLASAEEGDQCFLASAEEGDQCLLASAEEGGQCLLASAEEGDQCLLASAEEGDQFLDQNDEDDPSSFHTPSLIAEDNITDGLGITNDFNSPTIDTILRGHNLEVSRHEHNFLTIFTNPRGHNPEVFSLDQNSPHPISQSTTNSSCPNPFLSSEMHDHTYLSDVDLGDSFLNDLNSLDHNHFSDHFSFDAKFLDGCN